MKRFIPITCLLALLGAATLALAPALTYAGQGTGPGCGYPPSWDDPAYILQGVPFAVSGNIVWAPDVGTASGGWVIDSEDGPVTVNGLGPAWYWESQGRNWPGVGDYLAVTGYTVKFNSQTSNVAMTAALEDGAEIQLRDPETGWPSWSGR